jgi:hypothetical protein
MTGFGITVVKPADSALSVSVGRLPYLRVYKPHFFDKNLPSKIGVRLLHGI